MSTPAAFDYAGMVQRNLGFLSESEQARLRDAGVFVCGVGGMGGACIASLARAGCENLCFADFDTFELSNLNRQVFAFIDNLGAGKTDEVRRQLLKINPEARLAVRDANWVDELDSILSEYRIVVNGMDDIRAGIRLYRKAREHGATVIDAYSAPLPSVTVVRPDDPRPETRLGFPTVGVSWHDLTDDVLNECRLREVEYVMVHSSSVHHVDMTIAADVIAGRRPRMAFAPMVIMCFEVVKLVTGRSTANYRGYFFNPWTGRVERPRPAWRAWPLRWLVRRRLEQLTRGF